ncbi:ThiF family adenylyltransferase [Aquipuribacter hungaricus]|uniref:ThiF family adenylyltransferase n=1 Tax=Aquipuribacter hungaricus TaxID=545624 RepID=A0ABV7WI52_9MICO
MDEERAPASRPIHVVIDVDPDLAGQAGLQHLLWLLVALLTRSTRELIANVRLETIDAPLLPGIDPSSPDGGHSLVAALKAAADAFGVEAAPVMNDWDAVERPDLVLQIGGTVAVRSASNVLHVSAAGWAGAVTAQPDGDLPLDLNSRNPFGPYVAACLAAGQAYMYARVRGHELSTAALDAWSLEQDPSNLPRDAVAYRGEPAVHLDHVLAGVGAVGSALLQTLWAYQPAAGTVRAADADPQGVDDTNLNRCLPFHRSDLGQPKAHVAARRLSGHHGLVVEPLHDVAETLVGPRTNLVSAVDTPEARAALQDKYPASAVQASTAGLRLEMLRVDPNHGTACLRCFNPPHERTPDSEIWAQVAEMDDDAIAAHAAAVGTDPHQVRHWGRTGGCGQVGDALLARLRPSDGGAAQFSVGFMSVLAGTLLAAQVIKDAVRRDGEPRDAAYAVPLNGPTARFVTNCLDSAHAPAGARRYARDKTCPACEGVRRDVWAQRYTG